MCLTTVKKRQHFICPNSTPTIWQPPHRSNSSSSSPLFSHFSPPSSAAPSGLCTFPPCTPFYLHSSWFIRSLWCICTFLMQLRLLLSSADFRRAVCVFKVNGGQASLTVSYNQHLRVPVMLRIVRTHHQSSI